MELLKVKNFASVTTGGTPSTKNKDFWEGGDIPWLNSGELNQNIVKTTRNYITELGLKNSSAKLMPENTVLIALTGATTGVVGFLSFEASANQSVTGILPSNKHFPKYLFYYLKSIRPKVLHDAYGGAQPHISQGYVKELKIPLPPLDQQKKIAAILDAADAYRQKTKALIEKYDQLTQSLFLDMFGDPGKKEYNHTEYSMEEIANKVTDGDHATPKRTDKGYKLLSCRNVKQGYIDFEAGVDYVGEDEFNRMVKRCNPEKGDILISCSGTIGRTVSIRIDEPFVLVRSAALIKPKLEIVNSLFLEKYLQTTYMQAVMLRKANTSSQANLFTGPIKSLPILLPALELQNQFAERVQAIESQKAQAQASLAQSEDLFNSLLQRAFKGELV